MNITNIPKFSEIYHFLQTGWNTLSLFVIWHSSCHMDFVKFISKNAKMSNQHGWSKYFLFWSIIWNLSISNNTHYWICPPGTPSSSLLLFLPPGKLSQFTAFTALQMAWSSLHCNSWFSCPRCLALHPFAPPPLTHL